LLIRVPSGVCIFNHCRNYRNVPSFVASVRLPRVCLSKAKMQFAFVATDTTWVFQFRSLERVKLRSLCKDTFLNGIELMSWEQLFAALDLEILTICTNYSFHISLVEREQRWYPWNQSYIAACYLQTFHLGRIKFLVCHLRTLQSEEAPR